MIHVFVSSKIEGLRNERLAVEQEIRSLGMNPVMAEQPSMPAQTIPSKDACEQAARECDIYILLLGDTYGYEFEPNLSVTQFEYRTARDLNKIILAFHLEGEKEPKQQAFIAEVGDFKHGLFWKHIPKQEMIPKLSDAVRQAMIANRYPNGIFIFLCDAIDSAQLLFGEFVRKLGLDEKEVKTPRQLADKLQRKNILIILDNFETLTEVDANAAFDLLDTLVHHAGEPSFLVTSREATLIRGEQVVKLAEMTPEEAQRLFYSVAERCDVPLTIRCWKN